MSWKAAGSSSLQASHRPEPRLEATRLVSSREVITDRYRVYLRVLDEPTRRWGSSTGDRPDPDLTSVPVLPFAHAAPPRCTIMNQRRQRRPAPGARPPRLAGPRFAPEQKTEIVLAWGHRRSRRPCTRRDASVSTQTDRTARVIVTRHALIQNLRRGFYELGTDLASVSRLADAFAELALVICPCPSGSVHLAQASANATVPCRPGPGHRHAEGGGPGKLVSPERRRRVVPHLRRRFGSPRELGHPQSFSPCPLPARSPLPWPPGPAGQPPRCSGGPLGRTRSGAGAARLPRTW
jgi:hypothetical protein